MLKEDKPKLARQAKSSATEILIALCDEFLQEDAGAPSLPQPKKKRRVDTVPEDDSPQKGRWVQLLSEAELARLRELYSEPPKGDVMEALPIKCGPGF